MEQTCPCCERHCPASALRCSRGEAHFSGGHPEAPREDLITLLRRCGHFLHHSLAQDADTAPLLAVLTAEEQAELTALLKKCLNNWQTL